MLPFSGRRLHLQASHRLVEEEGQRVVVGVSAGPNVVDGCVLGGAAWEVLHVAEILKALGFIAMALLEELFVDFEDVREQAEQRKE